jgi:hypothetical protein
MNHPNDDQLVLYHYGEASGRNEVAEHLEVCESCRANYQALQRVLAAVETLPVPERAESYGAEVWRQLRPQLANPAGPRESNFWRAFPWLRWAMAGALGLLVLGAFLAGRFWPQPPTSRAPVIVQSQPLSARARERVLLTEIGDHLERSQLALIELINSKTNGAVDITAEQVLARELAAINRLYRRAAADAGEPGLASVLEELERELVEVANGPAKLSAAEFAALRERIDTDGLLFKVKVLGAQVRSRERDAARELAADRS